jgi:hypothetical protein
MYGFLRSNGVSLFLRPAVINLAHSCISDGLVLLEVFRNLELGVFFELLNLFLVLLEVLKEVIHIFLHFTHFRGAIFHFDFKLNQVYFIFFVCEELLFFCAVFKPNTVVSFESLSHDSTLHLFFLRTSSNLRPYNPFL